MKYNRWDIWFASVKFEDSNEVKNRPVLIYNISNGNLIIIALKMTSTNRGDNLSEYVVKEWQKAGLTKPTSIRLEKVLRLKESDLIEKIGTLSNADRMQLSMRLIK